MKYLHFTEVSGNETFPYAVTADAIVCFGAYEIGIDQMGTRIGVSKCGVLAWPVVKESFEEVAKIIEKSA